MGTGGFAAALSSTALTRPLRLRLRRDLQAWPLEHAGRRCWGLRDPLTLRYFQLQEEEFFLLEQLDGQATLEGLRERFEERFAPLRITIGQLQSFLTMLHREGLVLSEAPGQGEQLHRREQEQCSRELRGRFLSLLAIRFRGIDPDAALNRVAPWLGWMFSPLTVAVCLLLAAAAGLLVTVEFDTIVRRLPRFEDFFTLDNALWIAAAVMLAKFLHECGHAVACKHFGGECHEMGVMLLAFTPCLYVNVSDAWMLPNRWHRIAISAAGMYVELLLASVCTLIWWVTLPGALNAMCLNLMVVCSVSTLLFNGNPLLRYDGYYILSDLLAVPNLRQQASTLMQSRFESVYLGIDHVNPRSLPDRLRWLLTTYWFGAIVYRVFVVVAILWFLHRVLRPYRLEVLAELVGVLTVTGMIVMPLVQTVQFVRDPVRSRDVLWSRFFLLTGLTVGSLLLVGLIPLPHRVDVPAVIQPHEGQTVYVTEPGRLKSTVSEGTVVQPGDILAELASEEILLTLQTLTGEHQQQQLRVQNLESRQVSDSAAASELPTAREHLADLTRRLAQRQRQAERLTIRAPVAGTVLPPRPQRAAPPEGALPGWEGTPLEPENRGTWLETQTPLCVIGDPAHMEALLLVEQTQVQLVRRGQRVRLSFDQLPGRILEGTLVELAELDLDVAPPELISAGQLPVTTDGNGRQQLLSTYYQARVEFTQPPPSRLLRGGAGTARVSVAPQSLLDRLLRYLGRTFRFEL